MKIDKKKLLKILAPVGFGLSAVAAIVDTIIALYKEDDLSNKDKEYIDERIKELMSK